MKQIYLIILLGLFLSSVNVKAQNVVVTGCTGAGNGSYATLAAAAAAIVAAQPGATITININGNTTETAVSTFVAGTWTSLTISPNGARTVSGNVAGHMINFNGADNVTINGLNTGGNTLTISNTYTGTTVSTIRFINDATNNTITNCTILGSSTSALIDAGGTILFSTGTTNGNDNNTISYCNIGPAGANLPSKAIMASGSTGSTGIRNSSITISHNNIYDFFLVSGSTSGIYVYSGNDNWTIDNNNLYRTSTNNFNTSGTHRYAGITLNTITLPGSFTVTDNIIGFATAIGTGTTTISGTGGANSNQKDIEFRGIDAIQVSTSTPTTINGNIVSGISLTTRWNSTNLINSSFIGISLGQTDGSFECGTTTGNTIGSLDISSTITVNSSTTTDNTAPVMGVLDVSNQGNNISNNNIGSITINQSSSSGTALGFAGIYISTATGVTATTENNTIGGAGSSAGITDNHTGNYVNYGIYIGSANPQANNNIIRNITTNSSYTNYIIQSGIFTSGSTGSAQISNNTIHSLSNNSNTANNSIYAINTSFNSTATNNIVSGNIVHSLNIISTNKSCQLVGIRGTSNSATNGGNYRNNMIRLGIDANGNSITGGYAMYGIFETTGSNNFDYNSVYIGGSGVVTSSATYSFVSNVSTYTRRYSNNIFYNARNDVNNNYYSNFAIAISGLTSLTCNYNDLYVSGNGGTLGYSGGNRLSFTNWRTATGTDANSVNVNPQFINPTGTATTVDLHLQNYSPLNALATPITGITTDYDATARDATTPDIGADEINGLTNMVTVTATVGVLGPTNYANVRNAFNAINNGTHMGSITVSINANTYEIAQAVLNRTGSGSANYTSVNMHPVNDGLSINSNLEDAAIKLNNATNVTIDGDNPNTGGTNRNLSIINTEPNTSSVLWVGGSAANAADNVTIKNCNVINGTQNSTAIVVSDASTIGNAGYFNNITIENNNIQKAFNGVYIKAVSASNNGDVLVKDNVLTSSGANCISGTGIYFEGVDGASSTGNTISNISYSNSNLISGIWVGLGSKNCTVDGNTLSSLSNTATSTNGLYTIFVNSGLSPANISISNNTISGISNAGTNIAGGILIGGTNTSDVTVSNNTISTISYTGTTSGVAYALYANTGNANSNISYTGNTVSGVTSAGTGTNTGLIVSGATGGVTIQKNSISNIKNTHTTGYGCNGIWLGSSLSASNINVFNNFIYDVAAYGYNGSSIIDNGYGIVITSGGGYNVDFNTVHLNTNQTRLTGLPACINITNGVTTSGAINLRNNIFTTSQTVGTNRYAIYSGAANTVFGTIDYNDYYTTGSNLGYIGGNRANLAAIITGFGGNANSINYNPTFVGATNLHLTAGSNNPLKAGNYVTGITTDIDGDSRNLGLPAIGADEYKIANLWSGNTSTDWGTTTNWDISLVPSGGADITIPYGVPNMPVLDGNRNIGNLSFIKTGVGTVGINGKTFTIGGAITGTGTLTGTESGGASTSNLVLNGTAGTVNFTQTTAATRSLNNLTLGASGTATIGNDLIVYGNVQVNNTTANAMNFNGQSITLKSNVNNTATIDKLNATGSNLTGATNVTMERWIPMTNPGPGTGRRYQLLTPTVTTTTTIQANWMEGGQVTTVGGTSNPNPGYGTHITGSSNLANHFDRTQTDQPSLFTTTNGVTPTYTAFANTNGTLNALTGYFLFVRGGRDVSLSLFNTNQAAYGWVNLPSSNTTLRATGTIQKGQITSFTNPLIGGTGAWNLITNPYPAPIDWSLVNRTNVNGSYKYWDPHNGNRGGFVDVDNTGMSTPTTSATQYIQPGQAFFVIASGAGTPTITMDEADKAVGNNNNPVFLVPPKNFSASIFYYEGGINRRLADGVRAVYDNAYSRAFDGVEDAIDMPNWDENMAIACDGQNLVVDRRPEIINKDTMRLVINRLQVANYEIEFTGQSFPDNSITATLIDNFTGGRTGLSTTGTTVVPITVSSNPASAASDRFMVVFEKTGGPLPIDISSIKAYEKNNGIQVDWVMSTEQDMDKYEVEKSTDGRHFVKTGTVLSKGNSNIQVNYGWFDTNPVVGDNYYRIRAIEKAGTYKNSDIVRVNIGKGGSTDISMYPNPFEGNGFNLQLNKFAAGTYTLTMYNSLGQQVYNTTLTHGGGSATQFISLGKDLAAGTYTIKINGEGTTLTRTITKK